MGRFLAETGIGPDTLRKSASDPKFLASVLDFVMRDNRAVRRIAAQFSFKCFCYGSATASVAQPSFHIECWWRHRPGMDTNAVAQGGSTRIVIIINFFFFFCRLSLSRYKIGKESALIERKYSSRLVDWFRGLDIIPGDRANLLVREAFQLAQDDHLARLHRQCIERAPGSRRDASA